MISMMTKCSSGRRNGGRAGSVWLAAMLVTAGCTGRFEGFSFSELSPAATDAEKRSVRASDTVLVDQRIAKIGFTTILRSGQSAGDAPNHVFGEQIDDTGQPLLREDGSLPIADSNDFSSLLKVGGKLFSVAQFESIPGAMYLTELAQDAATGALSARATRALDMAPIHGLWNPCAGSVTPWNTHLGSEEYEPDAKKGASSAAGMAPFFGGGQTLNGDASKPNPYFYGFPVEVSVDASGQASVVKHYSLGRFARELSYVLPDRKTVYQADDGTNVGFYLYVADTAGVLSAGSLYALKWQQTSPAGASELGSANISWIKLGHATDTEISALINSGVTFADLFDSATATDGVCPQGFRSISANGVGQECLALKTGREQAAAFLESRRYAGYLGATTELRKEEGVTFDPETNRLYVAYSEIQYGMEDAKKSGTANTAYDLGTGNDIKLRFNTCGGVYAYELGRDAAIGSAYVAKRALGVIAGHMTTVIDPDKLNPSTIDAYAADSPFVGSSCDIEGLANPDNLSFVTGRKTLLIGEDSGDGHQNDMVWSYNLETRELTRVLTAPYGAETTSVYDYRNLNGFGYIVSVVQHPYGESDQTKLGDPGDKHSYFGYIGPLPAAADERR
jgi:secreted PhoX family phosphatase